MTRSNDGFERHETRKRPRRILEDEVSLTKTNIILSEMLHEEHFVEVKQVLLLYNARSQIIGIKAAQPGELGYKISSRSISSRSFYHYFQIQERGRYRAVFMNGMLRIYLEEPTS